jgi:hypothetical protein
LTPQAFGEFLLLWDLLQEVQLVPETPDQHRWSPSSSGLYSSKSAYNRFFVGAVGFEPAGRIWKNWAPPRCKFFIWLATLNKCWTTDQLARRGIDHPERCLLCDQQEETAQHLLVSCVFAREVWFRILSKVGLQVCAPGPNDVVFQEWWKSAECVTSNCKKKGFNSLVMLVAWWLWKHRNACVFDAASPNISRIIQRIQEDATIWCLAGAAGLRALWP